MSLVYISSSTLFSKSANSLHVMKMANSFSKNHKNVELIVRDSLSDINAYEYYDVQENFKILNFKTFNTKLKPLFYALKVFKYCRSKDVETIFYGRDILSLSLLSFVKKNVNIEIHDIPLSKFKKKVLQYMINQNRFNKIVVISEALKKDFIEIFNVDRNKVFVAHDGADIKDFSSHENENMIGYVGSINQGRGIESILYLADIFKDKEFHILGGTKYEIHDKLKVDVIPNNVICHGYITQEEINRIMKEFYIVLAPYQEKVGVAKKGVDTSRWMSPLKLFEYMSFGKAMIVSDLPVLREILLHEKNSILVSPTEITKWSDKISELYLDKEMHDKLKKNAYEDLINLYTWDKRAEIILRKVGYKK